MSEKIPSQPAIADPVPVDDGREAAMRERARRGAGDALGRRIVEIYARAERDWLCAPDAVGRGLRAARELSSAERRFVADAVHELIRQRRRLAFLARSEEPAALLRAWLEGGGDERVAAIRDPLERLATSLSWPSWLLGRLGERLGLEEARELGEAMNHRAALVVRVNRLRGTREELAERLRAEGIESSPTRLAPDGLILHTHRNVYALAAFREGWLEVQDEGSQLLAELVAPPPRSSLIDACAGAGGKTLALGAALANKGRLLAFDVSPRKLEELRRRARRAGLTNVHAQTVARGERPGAQPAARVLVDAPCSGLGVVRRHPETKWRLTPRDLDELPRTQRAILDLYAPLVVPGGRLVYATCSVLPDENDAVVASFLAEHDEFTSMPTREILGGERALALGDGEVLRLLPHRHGTDGFYAAVLRRRK